MKNLQTKEQVKSELNKAGINISTTRTVGYNSFNLVYETYGFFVVNAVVGTEFETVRNFTKEWNNINICINN